MNLQLADKGFDIGVAPAVPAAPMKLTAHPATAVEQLISCMQAAGLTLAQTAACRSKTPANAALEGETIQRALIDAVSSAVT